MTNKPNARFWTHINGGPVKLALRPGQRLQHFTGGWTEEGWSSETNAWEYPTGKAAVYREWCLDGRDCDGRLTRSGADRCELQALQAGAEIDGQFYDHPEHWTGQRWPAWDQHDAPTTYDEYAQAAGY